MTSVLVKTGEDERLEVWVDGRRVLADQAIGVLRYLTNQQTSLALAGQVAAYTFRVEH